MQDSGIKNCLWYTVMRLPADFFINFGLLLLGIFLLVLVSDYPNEARMFPQLILIVVTALIALDIVLQVKSRIKNKISTAIETQDVAVDHQKTIRFLLTTALMIAFLYSILCFGFVLGVFIFIYLAAWLLGFRKFMPLTISSLIITAFMYAVFILIMDSYFPQGIIIELLRG